MQNCDPSSVPPEVSNPNSKRVLNMGSKRYILKARDSTIFADHKDSNVG